MINELRIGNLVNHRGFYVKIEEIKKGKISVSGLEENKFTELLFDEIEPIIFDVRAIKKFGGKPSAGGFYISLPNLKSELHFKIYGKEVVTTLKGKFSDLILDRIKHVHRFQNLFFELTNWEIFK